MIDVPEANEFVKDSFKAIRRPSKLTAGDILTFTTGVPLYSAYGFIRGVGADLSRANKWQIGDFASFGGKVGCLLYTNIFSCGMADAMLAGKNFKTAFFVRSSRFKMNRFKIKHTYF